MIIKVQALLHTPFRNKDVVLLQEVWVQADALLLMQSAAKAGLVYGMHFKSGKFGSGLVSLARFPITDCGFWPFSAAGDAAVWKCGDFYAGKGGRKIVIIFTTMMYIQQHVDLKVMTSKRRVKGLIIYDCNSMIFLYMAKKRFLP